MLNSLAYGRGRIENVVLMKRQAHKLQPSLPPSSTQARLLLAHAVMPPAALNHGTAKVEWGSHHKHAEIYRRMI
jgi:hypothetical protein